ncbi:MAG: ATP-dependent DNA helicase [Acidobacteria bacterium]|nr:ATP-dependent DNA helicase [Acidobacteriota bacterium]MBI3655143.1 ATP-dependent DNA helicase [Acidobacteriota bacterium]
MEDIFGSDGLIAQHHTAYEYRPQQIRMARAIESAIENKRHLCVEAGTGTGKTLAYLFAALRGGHRVIVSTGTKNLQEQVFFKDIPFVEKALGRKLAVSYMKGRSNYVCLEKLDRAARLPKLYGFTDGPELAQILAWAKETQTGDRADLSVLSEELPIWKQLDARRETCTGQKCPQFNDCFVTRARQQAAKSDLVIVNHHLFFANLALKEWRDGTVLPEFRIVIFDEAHVLEEIATQYFGISISNYKIEELARDTERTLKEAKRFESRINETLGLLLLRCEKFFMALRREDGRFALRRSRSRPEPTGDVMATVTAAEGDEPTTAIADDSFREAGSSAADTGNSLRESYVSLYTVLQILESALATLPEPPDEIAPLRTRAAEIKTELATAMESNDPAFVYWYEVRGRGIFLQASPIDLAPILSEKLFACLDTVVLTSATLTTAGQFNYIRSRLGLQECDELALGSNFDYESQAILYLPPHMPDPRAPEFTEPAAAEIQKILQATEGRAFVLFTSFNQMKQVYERLKELLPYPVMMQGEMSRRGLLEKFKSLPHAVLFATSSFWQGVDVPGEALSCVIIDKLPFAVPGDPLVAARMNYIKQQGGNSFYDYQVPEAIIALRQGLGRLIRSKTDRGVLSVLDRRLVTRSYGRLFLRSLPESPITDKISDLRSFLNR